MLWSIAANTSLPPHQYEYSGALRIYVPLVVPDGASCSAWPTRLVCWPRPRPRARVLAGALGIPATGILPPSGRNWTHTWREGEGITFDATELHSIQNLCDERAVFLVLEVERDDAYPFWGQATQAAVQRALPLTDGVRRALEG